MMITREYLLAHRTANKAWTKAQFDVLGLNWPPAKGWMHQVVGKEITDDECRMFETAKLVSSNNQLSRIKRELRMLGSEALEHMKQWIQRL